MHRARAARPRGFYSLPSLDSDRRRLALCLDEVRILIFDDPTEQETSQRPQFCSAQLDNTKFSSTSNKFSMLNLVPYGRTEFQYL